MAYAGLQGDRVSALGSRVCEELRCRRRKRAARFVSIENPEVKFNEMVPRLQGSAGYLEHPYTGMVTTMQAAAFHSSIASVGAQW